jgi:hypothetical protein
MQNKSQNLDFEDDSNLRGIPTITTNQKPDSYYLELVNQITCDIGDTFVQDEKDKNIGYCLNNGSTKKLVQWTKVEDLWIPKHLTNSSQYKEVNGNVCKIVTDSCDSYNPSQDCMLKCFLNDKTTITYIANYMAFPK